MSPYEDIFPFDDPIEWVNQVKYLGLILDSKLTFRKHHHTENESSDGSEAKAVDSVMGGSSAMACGRLDALPPSRRRRKSTASRSRGRGASHTVAKPRTVAEGYPSCLKIPIMKRRNVE
ncbi:hypothetical protein CEXT_472931 [Caerostris extrusa]|uniref:Uncharacterized protein n=1 Tax=Caerostris extrusa TaxID=172846 RepID=A0AAV4XBQ6_CAEEX|nr:hypothetical protein CEXT_472931 [Caerostris extrusa]